MKDGVIADFTVTEQMLKQFIKMVHPRSVLRRAPDHHLRAVRLDAGRAARHPRVGARRRRSDVYLIEEPMAAAIGAGLPVSEAAARWWSTSAAARPRSASSRWAAWSTRAACGSAATSSTKHHQLHPPQLRHADRRAHRRDDQEEHRLAFPGSEVKEIEVKGRNLSEGVPRSSRSAATKSSRR
jgi:rod shape-determining protein MreB